MSLKGKEETNCLSNEAVEYLKADIEILGSPL